MSDLLRRKKATEKSLMKYKDKPFSWEDGSTCIHFVRSHAVNMGHKVPRLPRLKSEVGARFALKKNGWSGVSEMMNEYFTPIAPANMLLGDVAVLRGEGDFEALVICAGLKFLGWHGTDLSRLHNIVVNEVDGAWKL